MSNVLEALETIPEYYGCYFYTVIYRRTGILPRKRFESRLTVLGIAQFQKRRWERISVWRWWIWFRSMLYHTNTMAM